MKAWFVVLVLISMLGLGCASIESMFDKDQKVALSDVPQAALEAAKTEVPGIVLTEATMEEEDGQRVYEVMGMADGKKYEIEVTAEGKVLEVETGDDKDKD